jgi:hypothetical protein
MQTETSAFLKAHELAKAKSQNMFTPHRASRHSLRMPEGWRIPFELWIDTFRLRRTMLIYFVPDQGDPFLEWEDSVEEVSKWDRTSPPRLLPFRDAIEIIQNKYGPAIDIENIEVAWLPGIAPQLVWRFGFRVGQMRYAASVDGVGAITEEIKSSFVAAMSTMKLGKTKIGAKKLAVTFDAPSKQISRQRAYWIIWSCLDLACTFMREQGYANIFPDGIDFEVVDDLTDLPIGGEERVIGAATSTPNGIPTITLLSRDGWSQDPTIIFHEIGHGVWNFLFARQPRKFSLPPTLSASRKIEQETRMNDKLSGIQEGFADYFAATLLYHDQAVKISKLSRVPKELRDAKILPRTVTEKPFLLPNAHPGKYHFAQQWAHLLWDVRKHVGSTQATPIILRAHLGPFPPDGDATLPNEPLRCYFEQLKRSAQHWAVTLDWEDLAKRHGISGD